MSVELLHFILLVELFVEDFDIVVFGVNKRFGDTKIYLVCHS